MNAVTILALLWAIVQTLAILGSVTLLLLVIAFSALAINYYEGR